MTCLVIDISKNTCHFEIFFYVMPREYDRPRIRHANVLRVPPVIQSVHIDGVLVAKFHVHVETGVCLRDTLEPCTTNGCPYYTNVHGVCPNSAEIHLGFSTGDYPMGTHWLHRLYVHKVKVMNKVVGAYVVQNLGANTLEQPNFRVVPVQLYARPIEEYESDSDANSDGLPYLPNEE